jgi:hypothetical protein
VRVLDQCVDYRLGIVPIDLDQHHLARVPLDQGGDLAALVAKEQITLSMARHRAIDHHRLLTDRHGAFDPFVALGLLRVIARTTDGSRSSKMREELLSLGAAGLHVKRAIDRLA